MKNLFFIFLLSAASLAQANTIETAFKKSGLPPVLQQRVLAKIINEVPCLVTNSIKEIKTATRKESPDQGIIDYFYTTTVEFTIAQSRAVRILKVVIIESSNSSYYSPSDSNMQIDSVSEELSAVCH